MKEIECVVQQLRNLEKRFEFIFETCLAQHLSLAVLLDNQTFYLVYLVNSVWKEFLKKISMNFGNPEKGYKSLLFKRARLSLAVSMVEQTCYPVYLVNGFQKEFLKNIRMNIGKPETCCMFVFKTCLAQFSCNTHFL